MTRLNNVCLIGANTTRTKAYLQVLLKNGYQLSHVYIMCSDPSKIEQGCSDYQHAGENMPYFNPEEPVLYTLKQANTPVTFFETENINDVDYAQVKENYLIYSGFGGQILKPHLFDSGRQFIHVHAGILPQFRGSTTIYYSMLKEGCCGATAIFLSPGIDEGNVITMDRFPPPSDAVNIDYIYEPYTRARVLVKAMEYYARTGRFDSVEQGHDNANTYFIIHPVLKHIALKKMSGENV